MPTWVRGQIAIYGVLAGSVLVPSTAVASNCADLPVPPIYEDLQCLQLVDRSTAATVHLNYTYDPGAIGLLQAEQTVRWFAFPFRPVRLPTWLTMADWQAAKDEFAGSDCELGEVPMEGDVLELNDDLKDVHWELAGERPVTLEEAMNGVDIDTADLPPGSYHVYAYHFTGRFNAFVLMGMAWKVADSEAALMELPPTVFLRDIPQLVPEQGDANFYYPGQKYTLHGCGHGPGVQLDVAWGIPPLDPTGEEEWHSLAQCMPAEGEIEVPFILPPEVAQASVHFQGIIEDNRGLTAESTTGYNLWGPSTEVCTDPSVPVKPPFCDEFVEGDPDSLPNLDFCGDDDDGDDADDGDDSTGGDDGTGTGGGDDATGDAGSDAGDDDSTDPGHDDGDSTKTGCRVHPAGQGSPWWLGGVFLLAGIVRRRRR